MRRRTLVALLACLTLATACQDREPLGPAKAPCAPSADLAGLRLNQLQVVGSHNSYRRRTYAPLFAFLQDLAPQLPPETNPASLDYDHLPLAKQLDDYDMRGLELDIYNDPAGGRFSNRMGLQFIGEPPASGIPALMEPGFKVLHIPDFDYETHHHTLRSALEAISSWSRGHPRHLPLFVHIETKESTIADVLMQPALSLTTAIPFDAASADALDAEIRAALGDDGRIITPDEVRGGRATLEQAVLAGEWPLLEACLGRVLFFMEGAAVDDYVTASPGLRGRLAFVNSDPGQEHAAIILRNMPLGNEATIADLVRRGYIVRTMADSGTAEARSGDRAQSQAALTSGAHIVSTDYYRPDPRSAQSGSGWTNYQVALPGGGPARTNPINAAALPARICD